ncbi:MAG: outer membrane beta-barrel protein [Candidatus Methylacidiphilales bacterium]|nr:outer membrane beta-barrel protein [Candidatus Methylacidiphilales bacterium]
MNKMITGFFAAVVIASPAFADVGAPAPTAKDLEKVVEKVNYVETAKEGVKLSGYVDAGYTYNFQGARVGGNAVDDKARGDFNLNAVKLTLEKPLSSANEFQAGFRADIKVGEDSTLLATPKVLADIPDGFESNDTGTSDNFSLDQAYVIIRAPIGNGLDITVGKFASLLGYEVDDRPANLNITYGYDWFFTTTHQTGVKLFYPVNDTIELQAAISNGSGLDTQGLDTRSDGYGYNFTINVKNSGGNANIFNGVYVSNTAEDGIGSGAYLWNIWGNWAPKFANDKLLLGFSSNLNVNGQDGEGDDITVWTGSLYAKYQVTDIFSLAGRASYLSTVDGENFGFAAAAGDAYSWTGTAGFDLLENLLLRAEYRTDFTTGLDNGTESESDDFAQTISLQAVYTF